jgi:hypothetical protein
VPVAPLALRRHSPIVLFLIKGGGFRR